ncbi:MAG: hypothetical protein RL562_3136 [Planctomycetota bacterium]
MDRAAKLRAVCGIVGVSKSVCPDRQVALAALEALRWRGRDALVLTDAGDQWLGVARLRISDPSADQPILCRRTGRLAALNGAVTSAAAEWARHAGRRRPQTHNDAELLLLTLEQDGPSGFERLTGPHAFAVVDPQSGDLWLGRDPEGEKPLWILQDAEDRVLAYASTRTAARIAAAGLAKAWSGPGAEALERLLRFGLVLEDDWVFQSNGLRLRLLPPGVWHAPRGRALRRVEAASPSHSGQPFEAALHAATARCADAEVPVALALSGGIDSACLAVCLADHAGREDEGRRLPIAYHARLDDADGHETQRARDVASQLGMDLVELEVGTDAFDATPSLIAWHGMPLPDPSVVAVHALARRAAEDGHRVLLSGEGADELLLGYPRHRAAAKLPRMRLPLPRPGLSMRRSARAWRALTTRPAYDALLEVAPPAFLRAVCTTRPSSGLTDLLAPERTSHLEGARIVDRIAYLRGDLLPKLDVATLAASIEGRCPFLDPAVTRSRAVCTPVGRQILGKRPLRDAFATRLPPGHFDQPKRGFASPVDRAFRGDGILPDLLCDRRTLARDHLRGDGVRRMLDLHRQRRFDLGHPLFVLASLELALRASEDVDMHVETLG